MKKILFFSPDLNLCTSLLMFFNDKYVVTTTTDIEAVPAILRSCGSDLLLLDAEPSSAIEKICWDLHTSERHIPIILTYVFTGKFKDKETGLKKYVEAIYYKPFELNEISRRIDKLLQEFQN